MKKVFMIFALAVCFGVNGFSQQNIGVGGVPNGTPTTTPAGISWLETQGKLITQNFQNFPIGTQITGSFTADARWNSMGSLTTSSQLLNGFRTQTDGRALTSGFSIPNGGTVSNPFIEWIGNSGASVTPGNLEFKYALSPTSATRVDAFTIEPVTPTAPFNFNAFAYARANCLLGQLQSGVYGGLASTDKWVGVGNVITSTSSFIGTRVQSLGTNLISGVDATTAAFIQFNSNRNLQFRGDVGTPTPVDIMQMNVNGNISTGTNPSSIPLSNVSANLFVSGIGTSGASASVGVYARPSGGGNTQLSAAVYGETFGGVAPTNVGIYGTINNTFGIFATDYAGFFNGQVSAAAYITASDKRLKKDIKTETSALEKIMQLKPVSYTYDKNASKWMNLEYERKSHGFIADEVLAVFPEMVNEFNEPVMGNAKELEAAKKFKAVNYIQLISVLTKGMQEQQAEISALKNEIAASRTMVLNNKTALPAEIENKAFSLSQNAPNPFSERTTISYSIPTNVTKAVLAVFDLNGRMLQQYNLLQGKNQLTISGNSFPAGMYIYSLIADGQEVVSKRMILTK